MGVYLKHMSVSRPKKTLHNLAIRMHCMENDGESRETLKSGQCQVNIYSLTAQ